MSRNKDKKTLVIVAMQLTTLGIEVENARDALTALVGRGVPYDSEEMRLALERFQVADAKWKEMERGYLELRKLNH